MVEHINQGKTKCFVADFCGVTWHSPLVLTHYGAKNNKSLQRILKTSAQIALASPDFYSTRWSTEWAIFFP